MSLTRDGVGSFDVSASSITITTGKFTSGTMSVGDIMFLGVVCQKYGYEDAISFPSGWTSLGGPYTYTSSPFGFYTIVGYKVLDSADVISGIVVSTDDSSTASYLSAAFIAYSGISPHYDVSAIVTGGPTSSLDVDVTPTNAGEWLVGIAVSNGVAGDSSFGGTVTLTEQVTDSDGVALSLADSTTTVAQSLMSEVFSNSENELVAAILVAIADTSAPAAPTLSTPTNAGYIDVTSGVTLGGYYNSTDNENMNAYALEIKTSSGSLNYYNAGTNALQSGIVWNTLGTQIVPGGFWSVTLPNTLVSDAYVYNWSLASQEAGANLQGSFATMFTFVAQLSPSTVVNDPTGTIDYTTPTVSWTNTLPGGASQIAYEVVIATAIGAGEPGGDTIWTSGIVPSSATSQVTGNLANGTWYAYVQITETGGQTSSWAYSAFTVSFNDPPSTPSYTVEQGYDGNGVPCLIHTIQSYDNLLDQASSTIVSSSLGNWCCALSSTVNYGGPVNGYDASSNASHILLQSGMSVVTSPGGSNFKQGAATTGTSGYLEGPAGTGAANGAVTGSAFTVEFLFETPSIGAGNNCGIIAGRAGEWNVAYSGAGGYFIYTWYDSSNTVHTANGSHTPAANTVYNVCMEWNGTDVYGFVNGVLDATIAVTSAATPTSQSMEMMNNSIAGQIIDEVRVSNTARYTGIGGLLYDSGPNNQTLTNVGGVTQVSSPSGSSFGDAAVVSSTAYLDGTIGTANDNGAVTGSAFTVECIITPSSVSGNTLIIGRAGTTPYEWEITLDAGFIAYTMWNSSGTAETFTGTHAIATSTTYAVAMTWDGTTIRGYVNGVLDGSTAMASQQTPGTGFPMKIGGFAGDIDEIRISNIARYTGASYGTTYLTDSSGNGTTLTQFGTVTQVAGASGFNQAVKFNGSGSSLQGPTGISAIDGACTGSAFTAECFYTPTTADLATNSYLISRNASTTEWLLVYAPGDGGMIGEVNGSIVGAGTSMSAGTRYHIAMTFTGTVWHLWVNGVDTGAPLTAGAPTVTSSYLNISGYEPAAGGTITGTIDEVRISNSNRYTTAFTPPTTPFTADANTLMLYHLDSPGPSTEFTSDGNTGCLYHLDPITVEYTPDTSEFTSDGSTEMLYHFDGGLQISSAEALDGGYSLEWISATGSNYAMWQSYASQIVDIGAPYSIQASFYEPGSNPATVTINWLTSTGSIISSADATKTGTSGWETASFNATSPSNAWGVGILITPPTGATSLLIDEIGIEPGTNSAWTLGGYAGTEIISILRSDGLYVRNAGYTTSVPGGPDYISVASGGNCTPLNFPSQSLVLYDYESVPEEAYTFVLEVQAGGGAYASAVAGPITFSLAGAQWWLIDPVTPSLSVEATVTAQTTSSYKLTGANYQLSDATTPQLPSVTTMASFGESGTITVQTQSPTEFGSLKALVSYNDTKLMINPFSQGLYVSIAVADPTGGTSGEAHSSTFKGGTAANPYRESSLTYTQVGRA